MIRSAAYDAIPHDAVWTASFGLPTEPDYAEYFRRPDGTKIVARNGGTGCDWSVTITPPPA